MRKSSSGAGKTRIWTKLLIIIIIIVAALMALLFLLMHQKRMQMDTSFSFGDYRSGTVMDTHSTTVNRAPAFADDLTVSNAAVVLDDLRLNATTEKALLFDLENRTPLFAQGIYDRAFPASLTKIMTAVIILEYGNPDEEVTMEAADFDLEEGAQLSGLREGDVLTLDQLYCGLLVYSGNDCAMAAARTVGGTVDRFVEMMNDKAKELGMTGTHFTYPHGLHDPDHYTTAYDVYIMLQYISQYPHFLDTAKKNVYTLNFRHADGTDGSLRLDSTDKYLTGEKDTPAGVHIIGGKTGTTDEAGACLALIAQNDFGVPYAAVVMNAFNSTALYADMSALLNYINK